jgi:ATP-dependent Lon protease
MSPRESRRARVVRAAPAGSKPSRARKEPVAESTEDESFDLASLAREPRVVPILPVRQTVLFPYAILPLSIGRERNVALVKDVMAGDRLLAVFAQRDGKIEDPSPQDLYEIGTLAIVMRMLRLPDGSMHVLVQGAARVRLGEVEAREPYLKAKIVPLVEREERDVETDALAKTLIEQMQRMISMAPQMPAEILGAARELDAPSRLADFLASLLDISTDDRQRLLEELDVKQRLKALTSILERELLVLVVG